MSDFTLVNLSDLDDQAPSFGVSDISFRGARDALGGSRFGLSLQSVDAGARQPFGHRHTEEEEVYVVLSGSGRMRLGEEEIDVRAMDAVRVAPEVTRAFEAGADGLTFLAFGTPGAGSGDGDMQPGWWGEGGAA